MKIKILFLCLSLGLCSQVLATIVEVATSQGKIMIELNSKQAPNTVNNFLSYVKNNHYTGAIFHRVIDNFMIQGGGFDKHFNRLRSGYPIKNEADNGLKNQRGAIAMARTNDPHSAQAQFFINTKNNEFLNHTRKTPSGWGYAVFGKVIDGMEVVDKISKLPTGAGGPFDKDVPKTSVIINAIKIIKE